MQGSGKLQALQLLLDALSAAGKRTVVAAHASLAVLSDYLRLRYGADSFQRVDDETPAATRDAAVAAFNSATPPAPQLLLLEVASCSLGTDLHAADSVIVYDSDGDPSGDIQRFGCARRLGNPARLLVFRLYCSSTLEEVIVAVRSSTLGQRSTCLRACYLGRQLVRPVPPSLVVCVSALLALVVPQVWFAA